MFRAIDWRGMLGSDVAWLEIILRGSAMYLGLFVLLRVILKRQSGAMGITDLLLITLLADASQNAMAGEYHSVPDGLVLVSTLIGWNYFFDWLSYRSKRFARLIEPPPLPLVRNGEVLRKNLRSELITLDDLRGQLREQGIETLAEVKLACMESDGRISVIKRTPDSPRAPKKRKA